MTFASSEIGHIELSGVSKRYRMHDKRQLLAQHALKRIRRAATEFWALRDVTLRIERGESVAVIGHNGAGKSTLLSIILGVIEPSEGQVRCVGKVGALLELGTGFHPDLTGLENISLSASLLGLSRAELHRKLDSIVAFSELQEFLHEPVRTYSSGMVARLGFSVAIHIDPDILALDEVLAVGDENFQKKCVAQVQSMSRQGKTLLFVSHDLDLVCEVCRRTIWLEHGGVRGDGPSKQVVAAYRAAAEAQPSAPALTPSPAG